MSETTDIREESALFKSLFGCAEDDCPWHEETKRTGHIIANGEEWRRVDATKWRRVPMSARMTLEELRNDVVAKAAIRDGAAEALAQAMTDIANWSKYSCASEMTLASIEKFAATALKRYREKMKEI